MRLIILAVLLAAGVGLVIAVTTQETTTPLPASLVPAFELLGTPIKGLDHLVTRVIPVDDLDEKDFGLILHAHYATRVDTLHTDYVYLNELMGQLAKAAQKPFEYKVYPIEEVIPNAVALPGGVVLVTTGLLKVLQSESELVSVLGHELGHIEKGHCLDAVKFSLLSQKVGDRTLGAVVDFSVRLLMSHSFSKTQENEADAYAYRLLVHSPYDPRGVGRAFASLLKYARNQNAEPGSYRGANPIRDYFLSHPPLELREAKYRARAQAWWRQHQTVERRTGEQNLRERHTVYAETGQAR